MDSIQSAYLELNPTTNIIDNLGEERLNFLRGDPSQEQLNGGNFRNRDSLLGDIINSAPLLVGKPSFPYSNSLESSGQTYSDFKNTYAYRSSILYVGSND